MEENAYIHVDHGILKQIDENMPPEEELQDLAEFFKVFGDGTRLKILYVLSPNTLKNSARSDSSSSGGIFSSISFNISPSTWRYPFSSIRILFSRSLKI